MIHDTIVDEIHQFRTQLLAQHKGDFAAYFATLMQKQQHPQRYTSFMQPSVPQAPLPPPMQN
nr:hypothetical protein [Rhodoferax sp.]